jgi:phospholipid/cholesterol/gamma-HCH transport system substrate-binding protein
MKREGWIGSHYKEILVGGLVLLSIGLMIGFGWLMGVVGGFSSDSRYQVLYAFAGGVEVGSPVRVSGVKVGKVERIDFLPEPVLLGGTDRVTIRLTLTVDKRAVASVREDSRFYVNMAGIIGERYIEVSPGSPGSPVLKAGSQVRGVDPPRIDQLLSQGYGVFGRVQDFLDQNEGTIKDFLDQITEVLNEANRMLKGSNRDKFFTLIDNLNTITSDLKGVTGKLRDPETKKFFERLDVLVQRAEGIDKAALKKFLQEEGIRARLF